MLYLIPWARYHPGSTDCNCPKHSTTPTPHMCTNAGVVCADLPSLPPRIREGLLDALQRRSSSLGVRGAGATQSHLSSALTATCWASAGWQDLLPSTATGEVCLSFGGAGRKRRAGDGLGCFDLVLGDGSAHDGAASAVWAVCQSAQERVHLSFDAQAAAVLQFSSSCPASITAHLCVWRPAPEQPSVLAGFMMTSCLRGAACLCVCQEGGGEGSACIHGGHASLVPEYRCTAEMLYTVLPAPPQPRCCQS